MEKWAYLALTPEIHYFLPLIALLRFKTANSKIDRLFKSLFTRFHRVFHDAYLFYVETNANAIIRMHKCCAIALYRLNGYRSRITYK